MQSGRSNGRASCDSVSGIVETLRIIPNVTVRPPADCRNVVPSYRHLSKYRLQVSIVTCIIIVKMAAKFQLSPSRGRCQAEPYRSTLGKLFGYVSSGTTSAHNLHDDSY